MERKIDYKRALKRIAKDLYFIFKITIKRLFCKHSYMWKCTAKARHIELDKMIVFSHDYECAKCGKKLHVKMDEQRQKEIDYEYQ